MVGRELPNVRPNGEDHRGEAKGTTWLRNRVFGAGDNVYRSWIRRMIRIHRALIWFRLRARLSRATRFVSQGLI